jgi:ketosteroid isomerase-like protein
MEAKSLEKRSSYTEAREDYSQKNTKLTKTLSDSGLVYSDLSYIEYPFALAAAAKASSRTSLPAVSSMPLLIRRFLKKDPMATEDSKRIDEAQIRELIDRWLESLRAKVLNGIMSCYAPDIVSFDLPPLQYAGAVGYRKNWTEWFPTFQGPIGYQMHELTITTGDDAAFSHSLNGISGKRIDGPDSDTWGRATVCHRLIHGKWMVAHEHVSVPFYMDSGKAAVDLKP